MPAAPVHAAAARALWQPRGATGVCLVGLAGAAAAPGDSPQWQGRSVLPAGRGAGAAAALFGFVGGFGGRSQPGTDPVAGAVWPAAHGLDRVDRHFAHPRHIVLGATARPRGPHFGAAVGAGAAPTAAHHSAGGQC